MSDVMIMVFGIILGVWSIPFVIFFGCKLGVVGYLRGKQLFHQRYGEMEDEEDQETT